MKTNKCAIVCDGKEIAELHCEKGKCSIEYTAEGKEMCKKLIENCC